MPDEKKPPTGYATVRGEERPPLPATVQTEKAPAWAISMQERIVAKQDANHDIVMNEMGRLSARIDDLESWRKTGQNRPFVGPQKTNSGEVRRISENDVKQDAAIANIMQDVAKLQATVGTTDQRKMVILEDIYQRGTSFIDSPTGRLLKGLVYLAIATYAAARGIHIGK